MKVRRALISVHDKTGIVDFARGLAGLGVDPAVGHLRGPRHEQIVEGLEGFDADMGGLSQEGLTDVAV